MPAPSWREDFWFSGVPRTPSNNRTFRSQRETFCVKLDPRIWCNGLKCSSENTHCDRNSYSSIGGVIPDCDLHHLLELMTFIHDTLRLIGGVLGRLWNSSRRISKWRTHPSRNGHRHKNHENSLAKSFDCNEGCYRRRWSPVRVEKHPFEVITVLQRKQQYACWYMVSASGNIGLV